jgi:hypothetical protein
VARAGVADTVLVNDDFHPKCATRLAEGGSSGQEIIVLGVPPSGGMLARCAS